MTDAVVPTPTWRATISLYSAVDGGRRQPIRSGYRAAVVIGRGDSRAAVIDLDGREQLVPGGWANVNVTPLNPTEWPERRRDFKLVEGHRVVGAGLFR